MIDWFTAGTFSIGAIVGSIIGSYGGYLLRRFHQKKDEKIELENNRHKYALELHEKFNSNEALEARWKAAEFLLDNIGKKYGELRLLENDSLNSVFAVSRKYEFLALAIKYNLVNENLVAELFLEIFMYWNLHFDHFFIDENFELIDRLKYLDEFFKNHPMTKSKYDDMLFMQKKHIDNLLIGKGKVPYFQA